MYNERLRLFFSRKDLKQKEIANILGYSQNMISRYLDGSAKFNADFIKALVQHFPEIDLQYIFSNENTSTDPDEKKDRNKNYKDIILTDIEIIEKKLNEIKEILAQKSHDL